ncbi:carbonic anhydrase [Thelephora ganbajun]|uniref:Carbonic anhydrase n=1 Tax=Thelephora ganbajun TaxID=370292 RepID=A0ACB6Z5L9_THEGA|nr:carbonic anhydrase [Thelephora ganbajun]
MTSNDSTMEDLLKANAEWARGVVEADPNFFKESAKKQSPKVLWIGCSDSRVPASVITGSKPGDIFVHRNIANQVHLSDDNALSVVDYAVGHLGVKHVVVVGHSNCGGAAACVKAASAPPPDGPPNTPLLRWLEPLTNLARSLSVNLLPSTEAISLLVTENVKQQVQNVIETETIKEAWARGEDVRIHGWVYDLSTGILSDLGITRGPELA